MAHEVFIGVPPECRLLLCEFFRVVKVRYASKLVGICHGWCDDILVDVVANARLALQGHHIGETGLFGNSDLCVGLACFQVSLCERTFNQIRNLKGKI